MPEIKFNVNIPSSPIEIIKIISDFENLTQFFNYLEYVKIIEKNDNETITEEKVSFAFHSMTYEIIQQTKIIVKNDNINSEIISGPLQGTTLEMIFEESEIGTNVHVNVNLKVALKFKILLPLVKNRAKMSIIAVLYKMHTIISESAEVNN